MLANKLIRSNSRRAAFSLIEVLVVMAIIVILAGVGTVSMFSFLEKAKENNDITRMKNIVTAMNSAHLNSGGDSWPDITELVNPSDGGASLLRNVDEINNPWGQQYVVTIQETPAGPQPYITSMRPNGPFTYPKK